MSQATLSLSPCRNSDHPSWYYLDERVDNLENWDCNAEAEAVFKMLKDLWEVETELDEKIQRTDEEIEIVEEVVGE